MNIWNTVDELRQQKTKARNGKLNLTDISAAKENETRKQDKKEREKKEKEQHLQDISDLVVDVVLITAVEDEYVAARRIFKNVYQEYFKSGFKYCLVNCEIIDGVNIVLAIFRQNNMGLVSASMTATYALNRFNPKVLLMCGVCAGVEQKSNLGDLIIFSPVYDYGSGKYTSSKFLPDYRQRQINGEVRPIIEEMCCDKNLKREIKDSWENQMGKPNTELNIHICPAGSGAAVITDEKVMKELQTHQRNLGAIDMESYAIAEVANAAMTKEIPWLVVKGVQDFATPLKNDQYREYAAYVSCVFVKKFLEKYYSIRNE